MTTITIERDLLEQAIYATEAMLMHFNFARLKASTMKDSEVRVDAHKAIKQLRTALAAPATAPEHLEWPEFEPWAQYVGMNVSKDADGYYTSETTDMAWQAWEMAKNQKMTVSPPATAPEPVAWLASYVDRYGSDREYVSTDKALANENDALGNATPLYRHPPATAPAQPSWQDAPTEPGMWACLYMGELSTAIFNAYEIEHFDRDEMVGCRWQFIPEDKQ